MHQLNQVPCMTSYNWKAPQTGITAQRNHKILFPVSELIFSRFLVVMLWVAMPTVAFLKRDFGTMGLDSYCSVLMHPSCYISPLYI